jgi:hypothetical protein
MSLKAFHIVFIVASIILALGFGALELNTWSETRATGDLILGAGALVTGIALVGYGVYFLRKLRHVSYL